MKKTIFLFAVIAAIVSCGDRGTKAETPENNTTTTVSNEAADKGLELVGKSDCFTCHKVNETSIGPSYVAVANKYAGQSGIEDTLAGKIIKGGAGNWGQVPMTPHPAISEDDAKLMVQYVLSLKENK